MAYNLLVEHAANEETALRFLQQNLLRSEPPDCTVTVCGRQMTLVRCGRGDEKCFRCSSHKREKVFLAKDTFFETCKNIVHLLFSWSVKEPIGILTELPGNWNFFPSPDKFQSNRNNGRSVFMYLSIYIIYPVAILDACFPLRLKKKRIKPNII